MPINHKNAAVVATYASTLLDHLRSRGIDPAELYADTHPESVKRIENSEQTTLSEWLSMFEIAINALQEPDLALKAGASISIRNLGVLGRVLLSCPTLGDGIKQLQRYIRLIGEFGLPQLEVRGDRAHFVITWPYADAQPPAVVVQFMLAARITLCRWFTGRPDLKWDAYFYFPEPENTTAYRELFGGEVFFGQTQNRVVMPVSDLQLPSVAPDQNTLLQSAAEADVILKQLSNEADLVHELRKLLIDNLATGCVSLDDICIQLGMNARKLQRRLKDEGTSFQQVLDDVRFARARQYLIDPKLQLAEIAFLLGYAEQSAFQHAFKKWANLTPGEFREQTFKAVR